MDEDNKKEFIPWVERFRPKLLDQIISHTEIVDLINNGKFRNILFYGPPGTGKTSVIDAYARKIYSEYINVMVLNINASEERGKEIVRDKINNFIMTDSFISHLSKMVILDEVDSMTMEAQMMLRNVMEQTENIKFCLICNYIKKITSAIQSRCVLLKFSKLTYPDVRKKIDEIASELKIKNKIKVSGIKIIYKISDGDMRKAINILQSTYMAYDLVSEDTVAQCYGYPISKDIEQIDELFNFPIHECYDKIASLIKLRGYSLNDVITELTEITTNKFLDNKISGDTFRKIIKIFHYLELNLTVCSSEHIQLSGLVSANR